LNDKIFISLEEAALILQTTPLNILMHIKRGLLKGTEDDGLWLIERASIDSLMEETGGRKADDVCTSGCSRKHACGGGCS
jgi:hypothetical protein